VLYGPPKIGKSTFGAESPAPIFITTEDGIDQVAVDRFPRATTWAELLDNLTAIATQPHEYRTLVLDTLNGAAELAAQFTCETKFGGDWGPKGFASFGHGVAATSEEMRRTLPLLDQCRERGMTVLLLAHTGVTSVKNPVDGDYQKFTPDVDRRIWARFAGWADIIGRAEFEYTLLKRVSGEGPGRAVGANVRTIRFSGSAAEDAGTRVGFELPERLPLSWQAFSDWLNSGDSETAGEVKNLWSILTPDEIKATLSWLGVRQLEEAPPTKLRQLLNRLRQLSAQRQTSSTDDAKEAVNVA
jgi:hypothetical protein